MSCSQKYVWNIVAENIPFVKRNCPKCKCKTNFINTKKFRVNANKNNIDVWLIHQCEKCKSTWNMTIYERINPSDIDRQLYEKFAANDEELAVQYGFDLSAYNRNKAEVVFDDVNYRVEKNKEIDFSCKDIEITIKTDCAQDLRVDKLLADNTELSRSRIQKMCKDSSIYVEGEKNAAKLKVKNDMIIHIEDISIM